MKKIILGLLIILLCGCLADCALEHVVYLKYDKNYEIVSIRTSPLALFRVVQIKTLSRHGMCEVRDVYIKWGSLKASLNTIHRDVWVEDVQDWVECVKQKNNE